MNSTDATTLSSSRILKIGIFVTHPIQYLVPLYRRLAEMPDLNILVHFFSDHSIRGGLDKDFNQNVAWDVPLLDGYPHLFVSREADLSKPLGVRLSDPEKILRDGKFDAVYVMGYFRGFEKQLLTACKKLNVALMMRGDFDDRPAVGYDGRRPPAYRSLLKRMYLKTIYPRVTTFCSVGKNATRHLRSHGVAPSRIFDSPYCVDDRLFLESQNGLTRDAARAELNISKDEVVIAFSGKFAAIKRPVDLVHCVSRMKHRDRVRLLMIGNGALREEIIAAVKRTNIRCTMPGFVNQSQLARYFLASDMLVLPSISETWGLVVNEAMLFGLPCVCSSEVGCVPDLIDPGISGWVFPANDITTLTDTLDTACASGREGLEAMGPAVRERISRYTTARAAKGIHDALVAGVRFKSK